LNSPTSEASRFAANAVAESEVRARKRYRDTIRDVWLGRCFDQPCRQRITAISNEIDQWEEGAMKAPNASLPEVRQALAQHFTPLRQAEIDASRQRTGGVKSGV
jgi:aspartate/methionine/tyrosine aminotransferase